MITAYETDAHEDLRGLSEWLRARGVPHRIFETSGRLHLAVPSEDLRDAVDEGVRLLRAGHLAPIERGTDANPTSVGLARIAARAPTTAALVVLAVLFYPATFAEAGPVADFTLRWLMIVPIQRVGDFIDFPTLSATLAAGELWRLWTPALLHFGAVHLLFNLLWLWEFGRRIEAAAGRARLLEAFFVLAPAANLAQYLADEGPRFGGLSGVVYGMLGYVLVAARRSNHPAWRLPASLAMLLLLFLVFFSTGATEPFGLHVANGAHWGGLFAGLCLAWLRVPKDTMASEPPDRP